MSEKTKPAVHAAAGIVGGGSNMAFAEAPAFQGVFECVRPNAGVVWREEWRNVVVNQGKQHILNRLFGSKTALTAGAFLALHSATTASAHSWADISGSQVHSYGANTPLITFASSYTDNTASASVSYGFTASTQTVSGAAVLFYSTNTMSTSVAGANVIEYSEGQFGASRQVQSGDTLNVTLTVSFA